MVIFDQLRISDDGQHLYIDAHVNTVKHFNNIYMDSLTIYAADCSTESIPDSPSDNTSYIYKERLGEGIREIERVIDLTALKQAYNNVIPNADGSFNYERDVIDKDAPYAREDFGNKSFSKHLFFVYIRCAETGEANPSFICLPCSAQKLDNVAATFDENVLHQRVMDYSKELIDSCTIPQGFTDFILLWNAFKAAIETEHLLPALKFYKLLFCKGRGMRSITGGKSKGCGCYG